MMLVFLLPLTSVFSVLSQYRPLPHVGTEVDPASSGQTFCSPSLGSLAGKIQVEEESGNAVNLTNISWQLGLSSALCYKFQSDQQQELTGTVEVSYVSLKTLYPVLDTYRFPLVSSQVWCVCDCPGGPSHCQAGADLCTNSTSSSSSSSSSRLCTSYYNPSVRSDGCFLQWLKLSSAVCCSLKVVPHRHQMFRAVRLGVPSVMATFKTVLKSPGGEVVDSRVFNVDLNTGAMMDWYLRIVVSSAGPSTLLSPGWYVSREAGGSLLSPHSHHLTAGLDINSLHSWDVSKPGWVKAGAKPGQFLTENLGQLAQHFRPEVTNCGAGQFRAAFSRVFIDKTELGGREVRQEFPFISGVRVWQRFVELEHSQSPVLSVTLQHRTRVTVRVQQSQSNINNFTAILYQVSSATQSPSLTDQLPPRVAGRLLSLPPERDGIWRLRDRERPAD